MFSKLHKTLLAFILIMLPPYFLLFTDEGQRIADSTLLWLMGGDSLEWNLQQSDGYFSRKDIETVFEDLEWQCGPVQSDWGDELCQAEISSFNSLPARRARVFFAAGYLRALQIDYIAQYHAQLLQQLLQTLGQPQQAEVPTAILEWPTVGGLVLLKQTLLEQDQASLIWLEKSLLQATEN